MKHTLRLYKCIKDMYYREEGNTESGWYQTNMLGFKKGKEYVLEDGIFIDEDGEENEPDDNEFFTEYFVEIRAEVTE